MKPSEILAAMPSWASAGSEKILSSPAWAMPCRLGETQTLLRRSEMFPPDTLDISILLEGEKTVLSIADSPHFEDLHAVWGALGEMPAPIVLALVEKCCGGLLQLVENALRRRLSISGMASSRPDGMCAFRAGDMDFAIALSAASTAALGQLRFIDTSHPSVREERIPAETQIAAFSIPAADVAALAPGDAILLPEAATMPRSLVAAGVLVSDANGVSAFAEDGRLRAMLAEPCETTLGALFDAAENPSAPPADPPAQDAPMKLVKDGSSIAAGRFGRVAGQFAFIVESTDRKNR